MEILQIQLFLCIGFALILNSTSALYEFVCTEAGLFTPYLHVYKGRNGSKIISDGPSFHDFRQENDIYVCINGPAYLYFSHNTTLGPVFETPELTIFSHKCVLYNKESKRGHVHTPSENIKKLNGVLLMGDPKDYRNPSLQLFTAPAYDFLKKVYVNGTSIIIFGDEDCFITKNGTTITIKPKKPLDPKKPQYCMRAFGEKDAVQIEEDLLQATAQISFVSCNPKPPATPTNAATKRKREASDEQSNDIIVRRKRAPPPTPPVIIEIGKLPDDCVPLPTLEEECKNGKPNKEHACNLFSAMTNPNKDPKWTLEKEWRNNVIELIGEIYSQTCPGISPRFAKLINRVIGFYLLAIPDADLSPVRRPIWNSIDDELKKCLKRETHLIFKEDKKGQTRRFIYLKQGKTPTELTHSIEEAENEFAFNWVIDSHWKIFATVLGICTSPSLIKTSAIADRFYITYMEDFLKPMNKTWIDSKDNLIFQYILGEFYNREMDNRLNDHLEASYVETNSESRRPLRPLLINDLQEDNYFIIPGNDNNNVP